MGPGPQQPGEDRSREDHAGRRRLRRLQAQNCVLERGRLALGQLAVQQVPQPDAVARMGASSCRHRLRHRECLRAGWTGGEGERLRAGEREARDRRVGSEEPE